MGGGYTGRVGKAGVRCAAKGGGRWCRGGARGGGTYGRVAWRRRGGVDRVQRDGLTCADRWISTPTKHLHGRCVKAEASPPPVHKGGGATARALLPVGTTTMASSDTWPSRCTLQRTPAAAARSSSPRPAPVARTPHARGRIWSHVEHDRVAMLTAEIESATTVLISLVTVDTTLVNGSYPY